MYKKLQRVLNKILHRNGSVRKRYMFDKVLNIPQVLNIPRF